jgi:uncharacterized protein (TIGR02444 family)
LGWPPNPFWDYALELYRREGVESACLELQGRHGLDVNFILLCCWLGSRGIEADQAWLSDAIAAIERWQAEAIRPLRVVRNRLKAELADPPAGGIGARWPAHTAGLRRRVLAAELDSERLEQLLLAERAAGLPATAVPGIGPASRNLCRYWRFAALDRPAIETLLRAAFPQHPAGDVAAHLDWLRR